MGTQPQRRQQAGNVPQDFVEPNAQTLSFFLAGRFKYFLHSFDSSGNYYASSLQQSQQEWDRKTPSEVVESMDDREVEFLLFYTKPRSLKSYGAVGSNITIAQQGSSIFYNIEYSNSREEERLNSFYGFEEPELSISLEERDETPSTYQNYFNHDEIAYSSLSSLGNITQESFTISSTAGSATELITDEAQQISDVGGTFTRGTIENFNVSEEIRDAADRASESDPFSTTDTSTVTTSGY